MKKFLTLFFTFTILHIQIVNANEIHSESNKKEINNNIYTAKEIYNTFTTDEKSAIAKHREEIITVTGIATKVGPDVYTFPSIEISEEKNGNSRALCVLPYTDYLKLRKVKKGDEVIIKGIVKGYIEKYDLVLIKECQLIEK